MSSKRRSLLPAGWRLQSIREVLDIENRAVKPVAGQKYRYVGLENIEQQTGVLLDAPVTDGGQIASTKYAFNPSHVLYGKLRPNLNKVAMPTISGVCSTDILPLAPKTHVLKEYLAFFLRTPGFAQWAVTNASGTKMPRIGVEQFLTAQVPVPPLPVQERIVSIVQRADSVLQRRREASELSRAILPSVFNDMFGSPVDNPKGYPRSTIGAVTTLVTSGYTPRGGARNYVAEGPLLIRSQNVRMLSLDLSDCACLPEHIHEEMSRVRVMPGDVLLNITGASIGRVAWADEEIPPANVNQHVCIIRADKAKVLPEYLAYSLATPFYQHIILNAPGSAQSGFNHARVRSLEILVPPIPVQRSFVMRVEALRQVLGRHEVARHDMEATFDALLAQAFAGNLTAAWEVSEAEQIKQQQVIDEQVPRLVALEIARHYGDTGLLVTAMMKFLFLIQMRGSAKRRFYQFVPYHYGPFAKELYADLETLQEGDLIEIDNGEEDKTRITLTDPTRAKEVTQQLPEEMREDIKTILGEYGGLTHKALLNRVYEEFPAYAKKSRLRRKAKKKTSKKSSTRKRSSRR